MQNHIHPIKMKISGNTAMWTPPDTGDSLTSYPAPTFSSAKAIFDSVLWEPDVKVAPTKVELCKPIEYHSHHTNYKVPKRKSSSIKLGNPSQLYKTVKTPVTLKTMLRC